MVWSSDLFIRETRKAKRVRIIAADRLGQETLDYWKSDIIFLCFYFSRKKKTKEKPGVSPSEFVLSW